MRDLFEILNVEGVSLYLDDCSLIFIDITIVRCAEYSYNTWQLLWLLPVMDFVALHLYLMGSYNQGQVVVV
jgi:hypothetical protein